MLARVVQVVGNNVGDPVTQNVYVHARRVVLLLVKGAATEHAEAPVSLITFR